MATKNPECVSIAKFTTPVPPEPSSLINSYCEPNFGKII